MDRLSKILVGIDFSPCAASALRQATRLARENSASLSAVHVAPVPLYPIPDGMFLPIELPPLDYVVSDAREQWAKWPAALEAGPDCKFEVVTGQARKELLDRVRRDHVDLLVVGAHGEHDARRGIGSVAGACVQHAESKVMVVREKSEEPFRSVLACIDFSETSQVVLEQAMQIAAENDGSLQILHVYSDPWKGKGAPQAILNTLPNLPRRYQQAISDRLRNFCKPLVHEMQALKATYHAVMFEGHGKGIVEFATKHSCDLVVLGTRGTWNARDFFWGSTAERVVREAPCSILAVKPPGSATTN